MVPELDNKTLEAIVHPDGGAGLNKIIGGDAATNPVQRGETFVAVSDGDFLWDRWQYLKTLSSAIHTASRVTGESDGRKAFRIETTTADAGAAGEFVLVRQGVEGFNIVPLIDGGLFVSGRIRSDVTGIICFSFLNSGKDRSFVKEINILAVDTFQDVAFFVDPLPTGGGTWDFTINVGLNFNIAMDVGSTFHTTPDAWQTGEFYGTSNQVNRNASIGNNIEYDKIQVEAGDTPHAFENLLADDVTAQCQRYLFMLTGAISRFGAGFANQTTQAFVTVHFPVTMRAVPVGSHNGISTIQVNHAITQSSTITTSLTFQRSVNHFDGNALFSGATFTAGEGTHFSMSSASSFIKMQAEI